MKFKCRFCNNSISNPFLDLGFSPPSNNYLNRNQLYCEEVHYPLKVYFCKKCYLVQNHTFVPKYAAPVTVDVPTTWSLLVGTVTPIPKSPP